MTENVRPIPMRMDLPPELAAIALPTEGDEPPIVILNANEAKPGLTYREVRLGVLIPVLLGWAAEKPADWVRGHPQLATAVLSSAAVAAIATTVHVALDGNETPTGQPPTPIVTTPAPTIPTPTTVPPTTPEPTPTAASTQKQPPVVVDDPPARNEQPPAESTPSSRPVRSRPAPTVRQPAQPTTPPTRDSQPTSTPPATDEPAETANPPQPGQAPPPVAPERDCALRVDVDPLLDVCVQTR